MNSGLSEILIPERHKEPFKGRIVHPTLWLWDSWLYELQGSIHLFCLAINRVDATGNATSPDARNNYPFHIRHFISSDNGQVWEDQGAFLRPQAVGDGGFERNVWSGSINRLDDGSIVSGFTGLREIGADRPFLQTLYVCKLNRDGSKIETFPVEPISCPLRDYREIIDSGYYLGPYQSLGSEGGEEGGPILAWRDPFIFEEKNKLHMFWSAKVSSKVGAIGHAEIEWASEGYKIEKLLSPILLPDSEFVTQTEVPKVYANANGEGYFMLVSACDRVSEDQDASEVTKTLRLYRAPTLRGPWERALETEFSIIPYTEKMFGGSFVGTTIDQGALSMVAPYTEYAEWDAQLTFAEKLRLNLKPFERLG